jgi:hypothetical protein
LVAQPLFHCFGASDRRGTREIIVEQRGPPHYGAFETLASSSKGMAAHPDYASAAKRFIVKGIETTIDDG